MSYLINLFSTESFLPHGHCYLWLPSVLWLNVISDALIMVAYISIPFTLLYFIRKRSDIPFNWIFVAFGIFILSCGTTHFMEIVTVWTPVYQLAGLIKLFTAFASIITAVLLIRLMPQALAITSPAQLRVMNQKLQLEIIEREQAEKNLKAANRAVVQAAEKTAQIEALRKGAERFRRVVESAPNAIVMINETGRIEMVNGQAEQIFGYTRTELLGQPVEILLPDRYRAAHPGMRTAFFSNSTPRAMGAGRDLFARRKNGSEFPVEIGLNPIETEEGTMVLSSIVDITERRRINELQEHLAAIVNSSADAIVSETFGGVITSWNKGAERLFGYSADEMIGQSISKLLPNDHMDEERRLIEQLQHGESVNQFKTVRVCKNGDLVDVSVILSPLLNQAGDITGITKIARDISSSKQLELQLLNHAQELERSNKELDTFAYIASHDLKSPLRGISQLASWLEEDLQEPDSQTARHLTLMRSRIARMERLLDDLLGYSRVGRVVNSISTVDCPALAREVFTMVSPPEGFRLNLAENLPTFPTFLTPFEQILRNLFSNAIKHHDRAQGQIDFSARIASGRYVFTVSDDGPGIAPQFHERVFVMFQTLRSRDEVEGSGMGLALVKKLVESHGGQVTLKSDGVRGTTIEFTWPMEPELREGLYG